MTGVTYSVRHLSHLDCPGLKKFGESPLIENGVVWDPVVTHEREGQTEDLGGKEGTAGEIKPSRRS